VFVAETIPASRSAKCPAPSRLAAHMAEEAEADLETHSHLVFERAMLQ
jgi:hypothetical protein